MGNKECEAESSKGNNGCKVESSNEKEGSEIENFVSIKRIETESEKRKSKERVKSVFFSKIEEANANPFLSSVFVPLLQKYEDLFAEGIPNGRPPIRGIETQIDFITGAFIPNQSAYLSNLEKTKVLQRQVEELMSNDYETWQHYLWPKEFEIGRAHV